MNAAGVKIDKYRFTDTQRGRELGRGVGREGRRPTRKAGARSSGSRSRSSVSTRRRPRRSASPSRGASAGSTRCPRGRCCPRGASGYVSSLGELTGLQLQGSQKRLEVVPYAVGQLQTQQAQVGNPFVTRRDAASSFGADMKFAVTPGPHADGHDQPRLRPGRGRPGGRQPVRLRDLLRRAAAVLRRGLRHLPLRHRLQRRRVPRPLLLAAHRPHAARHAARHRRRLRLGARRRRRSSARRS